MSKSGQRPLRKSPTSERRPRHRKADSDYLERYPDDDYVSTHRRVSADSEYSHESGRGHQEYFEERERYARGAPGGRR